MSTCHNQDNPKNLNLQQKPNDINDSQKDESHVYTVYDMFMTVSCHRYDSDMSLLCRCLQIKCYQKIVTYWNYLFGIEFYVE